MTKAQLLAGGSTAELDVCGVCFFNDGTPPHDRTGCVLPNGHEGPHEFVCTSGSRYRWETDMECTCEHCMRCDGDYCSTYWKC